MMPEHERSRLQCLGMTGTDKHCNSRSHSGTPSRGDNVVPQPDFQSCLGSHSHSDTPQDPVHGDDDDNTLIRHDHHDNTNELYSTQIDDSIIGFTTTTVTSTTTSSSATATATTSKEHQALVLPLACILQNVRSF